MIHAEEAETSIAMALGHRVYADRATRDAWDRGAAVREAGQPWTSFGKYGMTHKGPGVVVPDGHAARHHALRRGRRCDARERRDREKVVDAIVPRIVQVAREMSGGT